MNQKIIEQIKDHIAHNEALDKSLVHEIIKNYPQFKYEGVAYRILCFSEYTKFCNLENDSSFSKTLQGVLNYHSVQDVDYYPYIQLYKVDIIGLDLINIVNHFNIETSKDLIEREAEVILGQINNQKLIFNGLVRDFDSFIREKSTL